MLNISAITLTMFFEPETVSELKAKGELPVDRDTLIYIKSLIPGRST